jgi:branched-chain amino acid transport system substrate-binding protein
MKRRQFNQGLAAAGTLAALAPFGIVRAQAQKLKVGVLLPRSGVQALIGQSCQKGADLAPEVIKQVLGVDIEIMNADTESNADTARTRAERLIQDGAVLVARKMSPMSESPLRVRSIAVGKLRNTNL